MLGRVVVYHYRGPGLRWILMLEVDSLFEERRADQDATRPLAPH
jgi:hypothetical protein